jgi:rubrerythrin
MDQVKSVCLEQAIQMERDGKEFYLRAAADTTNPAVKMIFDDLARQEDFHIQKIGEVFASIEKTGTLSQWVTCVIGESKLGPLFGDEASIQAKVSASDLEALSFGLQIEEKSTKYYDDMASQSQDKKEKRFYLTLSQEERGHYLRLMDAIEMLSDPEGWNYMKGRAMADGG